MKDEIGTNRPLRVYADTSVFGGAFDAEFAAPSIAFFEQVRSHRFKLVASALIVDELAEAPESVRRFFQDLSGHMHIETIPTEAVRLRDAYLAAGIIGPASLEDAQHVANGDVHELLDDY